MNEAAAAQEAPPKRDVAAPDEPLAVPGHAPDVVVRMPPTRCGRVGTHRRFSDPDIRR